jgi:acyl-CoA thioester hydrolase
VTDAYRHRTRLEVRFRDIDAFRHVNNAAFVTYLEQARIHYLLDTLDREVFTDMPVILAAIDVDYRAPISWGMDVVIDSRVDWVGRTSFSLSHRMTAGVGPEAETRLAAEAHTVLVAYDYETEKPIPVPEDWRQAFETFEGRGLERAGSAERMG